MKRRFSSRVNAAALAAVLSVASAGAGAATTWDESRQGDLSTNGLAPTFLSMTRGANSVLGTTGNSGSGVDRDYFSFTVPLDMVLASIVVLDNTAVSGSVGFFGMQIGPQLTVT